MIKKILYLILLLHFDFLLAQFSATAVVIQPTCNSVSDGTVIITATGGNAPYQFSLNQGTYQNSNVFANLSSETYTASVKDASNEVFTLTFIITQVAPIDVFIGGTLDIPQSVAIAFATGGTPPYMYTWILNGDIISGAIEESIYILSLPSGELCCFVQDVNGCFGQSCTTIQNIFSTDDFAFSDYKTYPNPFTSSLTISNSSIIDSFEISSITGQKLIEKSINQQDYTIDLSHLTSGVYFMKVKSNGNEKWSKVIKE